MTSQLRGIMGYRNGPNTGSRREGGGGVGGGVGGGGLGGGGGQHPYKK